MSELLIVEELFLLAHDEASGRNRSQTFLEYGLAGALLLDLALAGRLELTDGRLVTTGAKPDDPLLGAAYDDIAAAKPSRPRHWVTTLPRHLKPFGQRVGRSLTARGVLEEQRGRTLGLFPRTRWPERDPEPERRLRAAIRTVLVDGAPADGRMAALIGLLEALEARRLVTGDLDRAARRLARERARAIVREQKDGTGVAPAVQASVREVQSAIMAATLATVAAGGAATN